MPDAAPAPERDPAEVARGVIDTITYMTLATADADGRPWASPVWFAHRGLDEFVWVSHPDARHSENLAANPRLGIAIYDSTVTPGHAEAVYVEAEGGEVADAAERAELLEAFSRRSAAQGLTIWGEEEVTGAARHRLYRARALTRYILGPGDRRIEVR